MGSSTVSNSEWNAIAIRVRARYNMCCVVYQFQHVIDIQLAVLSNVKLLHPPRKSPNCNSFRFAKISSNINPIIYTSTCGFYSHVHSHVFIYILYIGETGCAPCEMAGLRSWRCVVCVCVRRFNDGSCGCGGMMPAMLHLNSSAQPSDCKLCCG